MNTGNDILTFPLSLGEGWGEALPSPCGRGVGGEALPSPCGRGVGGEAYKIGRLGKTHGVNGEISFQFDDDIFDRVESEYLILEIDGILVPFFMEEYRFKSDEVALVKFEDIDTQERAAELTGCEVYFETSPDPSQGGEMSYAQLVGFGLIDATTNRELGKIAYFDDQTENIMFELEDGTLIPASEELIADIDIEKRQITMTLPEGLIDLNEQ